MIDLVMQILLKDLHANSTAEILQQKIQNLNAGKVLS